MYWLSNVIITWNSFFVHPVVLHEDLLHEDLLHHDGDFYGVPVMYLFSTISFA